MVQPDPTVEILAPAADAVVSTTDVVVRIEDRDFWMDGSGTARRASPSWSLIPSAHAYEPHLGFAEVRLDGVPVGEIHSEHDPVLTIPTVTPGLHVVEVELLGNQDGGQSFVPPVTDSVAFTAE